MKILVTGAAGFLGGRVINALLDGVAGLPAVSKIVAADLAPCPIDDERIDRRIGTITDPDFVSSIVHRDVDVIYHLAAVLSGQAEAEFDTGMQVNLDATRHLLETCRRLKSPPRFIFTSTIAVFGAPLPDVVPEDLVPRPKSSYGAEKVIGEFLVAEYARKGFIEAVVGRVPTVAIRPGRPNSAMSSFVSGIIREPLAGEESHCPVPLDTRLWITSPDVITQNLVHAARIAVSALEGRPALNLPGLCVTPGQMLDSLERLAGADTRARVRCEIDPRVEPIVCSWPGAFDISGALRLGFSVDRDMDSIVRQYMNLAAGSNPTRR
jgi:nucleoside-diphosphate-sugar epimerase